MKRTPPIILPNHGNTAPPRPAWRPGVTTYGRHRRAPAPTRLGWALVVVLTLLIAGVGLATTRAQDIDAAALTVPAAVATETAPTPEPTATEVPRYRPSARGGRAVVQELAEQHFAPAWVGWAVRTARCESSYDLYAHSSGFDRRYGWYEHVGAWQISVPTWGAKAWALFGGPLSDPNVGAAMAAWIVVNLGPSHWPVCGR